MGCHLYSLWAGRSGVPACLTATHDSRHVAINMTFSIVNELFTMKQTGKSDSMLKQHQSLNGRSNYDLKNHSLQWDTEHLVWEYRAEQACRAPLGHIFKGKCQRLSVQERWRGFRWNSFLHLTVWWEKNTSLKKVTEAWTERDLKVALSALYDNE